jgi:hypothetical protein
MNTKSILTTADWENFLMVLYFGSKGSNLERCINRAYRDLSRTVHGVGTAFSKEKLDTKVRLQLAVFFDEIKYLSPTVNSYSDFDTWHQRTCDGLIENYRQYGYDKFYVGQAQKWVNMTFKYIFTLGSERVAGFENVYPYCHVPLDNILTQACPKYKFPVFREKWSRLNNYDRYLHYQKWFRDTFTISPLDVEFYLWQDISVDQFLK